MDSLAVVVDMEAEAAEDMALEEEVDLVVTE